MDIQQIKKSLKILEQPLYFFYGPEGFYMDLASSYIDDRVPDAQRAFDYHVLYGKDSSVEQIIDVARRVPMGGPRQLVMVKEAQSLRQLDKLQGYLERPTPTTSLVMYYRKTIDKRKKIFKTILKAAEAYECKPLYDNQVARWLQQYLKSLGVSHDTESISLLTEYLGSNLSRQADAIEKLQLNLGEGEMISAKHVRDLIGINKDYDVFALQSGLASKNHATVLRIINYYEQYTKENPLVLIIGNLYRFFSDVMQLKSRGYKTEAQIRSGTHHRNPSAIRDLALAVRNYSPAQLRSAIHILHEYDLRSKGMNARSMSPGAVLKEMVGQVCV